MFCLYTSFRLKLCKPFRPPFREFLLYTSLFRKSGGLHNISVAPFSACLPAYEPFWKRKVYIILQQPVKCAPDMQKNGFFKIRRLQGKPHGVLSDHHRVKVCFLHFKLQPDLAAGKVFQGAVFKRHFSVQGIPEKLPGSKAVCFISAFEVP